VGSEQVSKRWVEGAERVCSKCGTPIKSLSRQLGTYHMNYYTGEKRLVCMECHVVRPSDRRREDAQATKGMGSSAC
jgi:hypothetical protein